MHDRLAENQHQCAERKARRSADRAHGKAGGDENLQDRLPARPHRAHDRNIAGLRADQHDEAGEDVERSD